MSEPEPTLPADTTDVSGVVPNHRPNGKFAAGNRASPGRPKAQPITIPDDVRQLPVDEQMQWAFDRVVSVDEMLAALTKIMRDARRGNIFAMRFIADYRLGKASTSTAQRKISALQARLDAALLAKAEAEKGAK